MSAQSEFLFWIAVAVGHVVLTIAAVFVALKFTGC